MTIGIWILLVFFLLYEPVIGFFAYRRFKGKVVENPNVRIPYYHFIMIGLWVPTLFVFFLIGTTELTWQDIGLSSPSINTDTLGPFLTYGIFIVAGLYAALLVYYFIAYRFSAKIRVMFQEAQLKNHETLPFSDILPVTPKEVKWWSAISFTAGVTEEVLYRGFLLFAFPFLFTGLPMWATIVMASFLFGLAHTYQGLSGVIRTGMIGAVFCLLYISLSSLWPLIILHFLIDYASKLGETEETNEK